VVLLVIPWLLYPLYAILMALWHYFKS